MRALKTWRSSTIIRSLHIAKKLPPIHPGEILREELLFPLKLTPYAVAAALYVQRTRIEGIAHEEKPVTADTALRLGKFFKTGAAFWMNIQARFDLETAEDVRAADQEDRVLQGGSIMPTAVMFSVSSHCRPIPGWST
jgi:addiction module HigA family antidote